MGRSLAMVVLVAGCGRFGFGDEPSPDAAAPPMPDAAPASPDAAAQLLTCGTPTRFSLGASLSAMTAAGTPDGFAVFADSGGSLTGWAYAFAGADLAATQEDVPLASGTTGALGAAAYGSSVMLSSMDGMPSATGTTIYALDDVMHETATPASRAGQLAATTPIATSGADGMFAFLTVDGSTDEVDAHALAADGSDAGAPVKIVDPSAVAANVAIATAPGGFVVAYSSAAGSPRQVNLELLDGNLAVVAGPVAVDTAAGDEYSPGVAANGNTILVTWHAKDSTGDDDVWIATYSSALAPQTAAKLIATFSNNAVIASDGTGFWVAWETYSPSPTVLGGAHVASDGTVTARPVTNSGGTPGKWAMVSRATQPVLVWTELGGSGPDLYFDPMCAP